jgi:predicted acylesterase/phospholipase RssA
LLFQISYSYNIALIRNQPTINLSFEDLAALDTLLVEGYHGWVQQAPHHWKVDGFIVNNSPIIVTSHYGQNAAIALQGNEQQEAAAWQLDRDYSKIAILTVAIATHIQYASPSFISLHPSFFLISSPFSKVHRDTRLG